MEQQIAYKLKWDLSMLEGRDEFDYYATLTRSTCPNAGYIKRQIFAGKAVEISSETLFDSVEEFVAENDYPYTNTSWPIMSRRMIDTLLSVGDFSHEIHPVLFREVQILTSSEQPDPPIKTEGWLRQVLAPDLLQQRGFQKGLVAQITDREFYVLNLLEQQDIFDWENSVYQRKELIRDGVFWPEGIKKLVFREPIGGLPPIFRESVFSTHLFISNAAKEALETANMSGMIFIPQQRFRTY